MCLSPIYMIDVEIEFLTPSVQQNRFLFLSLLVRMNLEPQQTSSSAAAVASPARLAAGLFFSQGS